MDQRHIPRIGVQPKSPDFIRLAQSLGCHAERASSAQNLTDVVRAALNADRPTIIEVRQDSPWLSG
jgi:thiamine pyrophosphate-dependent acetolactate synthase large subunit-like protein